MLWGRSTCMHSGILRSAVHTPFHEMGCGARQRRVLIGGLAKGTPNQAFTPEPNTLPATMPPSVWVGAMGVSVTWASSGWAAIAAPKAAAPNVMLQRADL